MDSLEALRERIEILKKENDCTAAALAEKCGAQPRDFSDLNRKTRKKPNYELAEKLADTFGVSIDWLLGRTDAREVRQSKQNEIDYYGLTYGEICKVITFLAAANVIHIIPDKENGNINIQIMDETIKGFLETLVALSLASVGKKSVCAGLHVWFESETQRLLDKIVVKEIVADKFNKAFPWKTADVKFDYSGIEEWTMENPAVGFNAVAMDLACNYELLRSRIDEGGNFEVPKYPRPLYMESYSCLIDGIVGYPRFCGSCARDFEPTLPQIEGKQPDNT